MKKLFALFLFLGAWVSQAQTLRGDISSGAYHNVSNTLWGSSTGLSLATNFPKSNRLFLTVNLNWLHESNQKQNASIGTTQKSFSKGLGVEYYLSKDQKISLSGVVLLSRVEYHRKSSYTDEGYNHSSVGFSPRLNFYQPITTQPLYLRAGAGVFIAHRTFAPALEVGLGYVFKNIAKQ